MRANGKRIYANVKHRVMLNLLASICGRSGFQHPCTQSETLKQVQGDKNWIRQLADDINYFILYSEY